MTPLFIYIWGGSINTPLVFERIRIDIFINRIPRKYFIFYVSKICFKFSNTRA